MLQKQCPWCGKLGVSVDDRELHSPHAQPHADGSTCVCSHVTAASRSSALESGGRYWDSCTSSWRCFRCGTARRITLDDVRAHAAP